MLHKNKYYNKIGLAKILNVTASFIINVRFDKKTKPTLIEKRMGKNCYEKEKMHLECNSKIN